MKHMLFFVLCALLQHSAFAAIYKCESAGGKVTYQAVACESGRELSITAAKPAPAPTSAPASAPSSTAAKAAASATEPSEQKQCVGKEMRIHFTHMPLTATLQVVADFSGRQLVADASVRGAGAFHYDCVPWDAVLQDIAARHQLSIKLEKGRVLVTQR